MSTALARAGRADSRAGERVYADALLHLAALSIVAGAIHAVVIPSHFEESWLYGAFFAVLAPLQLGWGAWIYARPSAAGFRIAVAINLAVIATWVVSRTVGFPFGPELWQPEAVGPLDLAATANELLVVVLGLGLLASGGRSPSVAALPLGVRPLRTLALAAMTAGLLTLFLGGGHAH